MRVALILILLMAVLASGYVLEVLQGLGWVMVGLLVFAVVAALFGAVFRRKSVAKTPAQEREERAATGRELPRPKEAQTDPPQEPDES